MNNKLYNNKTKLSDGAALYIFAFLAMYLVQILITVVVQIFAGDNALEIFDLPTMNYFLSFLTQATFIAVIFAYGKMSNKNFILRMPTKFKLNAKQILLVICIPVFCIFAFLPLANLFIGLLMKCGFIPITSNVPLTKNFGYYCLSLFFVAVLPSIGEEFLFRGAIANTLKQKSYLFAMLISAWMFSIMHNNAVQLVHQFLLGVVMCYVFFATKSIWASVIVHFVNNAIAITVGYVMDVLGKGNSDEVILTFSNAILYVFVAIVGMMALFALLRLFTKECMKKKQQECNFALVQEKDENIVKAYFISIANAFYPKGIKKNCDKINNILEYLNAGQEELNELAEPTPEAEVKDKELKALIEQEKEFMIKKEKKVDRTSLAIGIALVSAVWVIVFLTGFKK
ncbi:MAG: type II CAAX endopeptidase family protein [Clostridia bacterium]